MLMLCQPLPVRLNNIQFAFEVTLPTFSSAIIKYCFKRRVLPPCQKNKASFYTGDFFAQSDLLFFLLVSSLSFKWQQFILDSSRIYKEKESLRSKEFYSGKIAVLNTIDTDIVLQMDLDFKRGKEKLRKWRHMKRMLTQNIRNQLLFSGHFLSLQCFLDVTVFSLYLHVVTCHLSGRFCLFEVINLSALLSREKSVENRRDVSHDSTIFLLFQNFLKTFCTQNTIT